MQGHTIWKFPIAIAALDRIEMPAGVGIVRTLHVGTDPMGQLCLWIQVADSFERRTGINVFVYGTGHEMSPGPHCLASHFVGTISDGPFMWHVFTDEEWP